MSLGVFAPKICTQRNSLASSGQPHPIEGQNMTFLSFPSFAQVRCRFTVWILWLRWVLWAAPPRSLLCLHPTCSVSDATQRTRAKSDGHPRPVLGKHLLQSWTPQFLLSPHSFSQHSGTEPSFSPVSSYTAEMWGQRCLLFLIPPSWVYGKLH